MVCLVLIARLFSPLCWRKTGVGYFMFVWYYDGCDLSFRTYKICWLQLELMHPMRCALGSMPWNEASRMRRKFSETSHRIGDEPCCLQRGDGKHAKFSWATVASTVPSRASSLQGWRHTFDFTYQVTPRPSIRAHGDGFFSGHGHRFSEKKGLQKTSSQVMFPVSIFNLCCIWSCLVISYWYILLYLCISCATLS